MQLPYSYRIETIDMTVAEAVGIGKGFYYNLYRTQSLRLDYNSVALEDVHAVIEESIAEGGPYTLRDEAVHAAVLHISKDVETYMESPPALND